MLAATTIAASSFFLKASTMYAGVRQGLAAVVQRIVVTVYLPVLDMFGAEGDQV
jgi:hypothetical protein